MTLTIADPGGQRVTLDYAAPRPRAVNVVRGAGFTPIGRPLPLRWLGLVALFGATMLLPTLGGRRVLTRHEVFAAEPAREMLHGHAAINWVIPHFAGLPRTVKPPTTGWLIAGSMALFHSEAEWVVRLPSGLSAILMSVLVADLAARWLGPRVGLIAGLMQATFVYTLMQARLAEADMPMAAAVCLAMYALARGVVEPPKSASELTLGAMGKRTRLPVVQVEDMREHGQASTLAHGTHSAGIAGPGERTVTAGLSESDRSELGNFSSTGVPPVVFSPETQAGRLCCELMPKLRADPAGPEFRRSPWLPILFYFGTGLSFLLKGVGIVFILASVVAFVVCSIAEGRDWRRTLRFLLNPPGLLLLAVLLLAWPLAAWRADPHIFSTFRTELIGRVAGELGEKQPWYFYAGAVPAMLMPWLPFGIGAVVEGLRARAWRGPVGQFLLCWFAPGLLILSASAWKHHHYVIPMMPPATLAMAAGMELWLRRLKDQKAWIGVLLWLVGSVTAVAVVWRFVKTGRNEIALTIGLVGVGGAAVQYVARRGRADATLAAVFGTAWAAAFAYGFAIVPQFEDYRWSAELARRANREVPPGQTIYLLGLGEHNTAFYLRLPIARVDAKANDSNMENWGSNLATGTYYGLCPASLLPRLKLPWVTDGIYIPIPEVTVLDRADHLRQSEKEADRPVLVQIDIPVYRDSHPSSSGF